MLSKTKLFITSAACTIMLATGAQAITISTTIDFDAGAPTYPNAAGSTAMVDGYEVTPINIQSGLCETGECTIESGQTSLPMISRPDNETFSLIDFWISPTGLAGNRDPDTGELTDNYLSVTAFKGLVETTIKFAIGDSISPFGSALATVEWAPGEAATGSATATCKAELCFNEGYRVTLTSPFFQDVDKIVWSSKGSGQARLDTINLERMGVVPLPAAGWLLLAGLGGLAAMRRRKAA